MSTTYTLKSCVIRYYSLVDAQQRAEMLALFSEDCVYNRPGYEPLRGKVALARFYDEERVIRSGKHILDTLVGEGCLVATAGRFEGILKSGDEVSVGFSEVFKFENEMIQERTTYFYRPAV